MIAPAPARSSSEIARPAMPATTFSVLAEQRDIEVLNQHEAVVMTVKAIKLLLTRPVA